MTSHTGTRYGVLILKRTYLCSCVFTNDSVEREGGRERERGRKRQFLCLHAIEYLDRQIIKEWKNSTCWLILVLLLNYGFQSFQTWNHISFNQGEQMMMLLVTSEYKYLRCHPWHKLVWTHLFTVLWFVYCKRFNCNKVKETISVTTLSLSPHYLCHYIISVTSMKPPLFMVREWEAEEFGLSYLTLLPPSSHTN